MIRGKLNDFVKFRSVRNRGTTSKTGTPSAASSPEKTNKKRTTDSSFHADTSKIDAWMCILEDKSLKRLEVSAFHGVPELLELIRRMLAQNAELRPSAKEVRDRVENILVRDCEIETLCCAGREWEIVDETKIASLWRDSGSLGGSSSNYTLGGGAGSSSAGAGAGGARNNSRSASFGEESGFSETNRSKIRRESESDASMRSKKTMRFLPWKRRKEVVSP